jgi:hypothetical protein
MRNQLMGPEILGVYIMQGKQVIHVECGCIAKSILSQKNQYINNYQIFYYRRDHLKTPGPKLCHNPFN